jgi:hypothetical protein
MLTVFPRTEHGKAYRFALSGSSARKLRRSDANLLAGCAINRQFFPLTAAEIGRTPQVDEILRHGLLPQTRMEPGLAVDLSAGRGGIGGHERALTHASPVA